MHINANIIEAIKSYPMSVLAKKLGYDVIERSGRSLMLCPFHKDTNIGSFYIFDDKNFKCFACGESGDNITLGAKFLQDQGQPHSFVDTIKFIYSILKDEGVNLSIYTLSSTELVKEKNYLQDLQDKIILDNQKHMFYKLMLKFIGLEQTEKDILINHRQLGEKTIAKIGYSSLLTKDKAYEYKWNLEYVGGKRNFNEKIPGIYEDFQGDLRTIFQKGRGIFIPIRNEDGLIVALQIRVNESKTGQRYFWYTSGINKYNQKYIKKGWSASPENDYNIDFNVNSETVVLTEGHFKQLELSNIYESVISMQGITQTKKIKDYFNSKKISEEVLKDRLENYSIQENNEFYKTLDFKAKHKNMVVYLDQDVWADEFKYKQLHNMFDYLLENNYLEKITIAYWNDMYGKIDDLIINDNYDLVSYQEYIPQQKKETK